MMKYSNTQRGFAIIKFSDRNDQGCSLQKSSIATEDCLWLGVQDANPLVLVPGEGWQPVSFPSDTLFSTRMHLNREQVEALLPLLQHFVDRGNLPHGCVMMVGHHADENGEPGEEIYCTNKATHAYGPSTDRNRNIPCCAECAEGLRKEGFDVVRRKQ